MNVSLSSNSATNKTSSLLDTGSASSKVEETGDSKGFFESFKEALGFEESGSKAAAKDTESTAKPDTKQASTEGEVSAETNNGDSAESKATDEVSEAKSNQAASEVEGEKAAEKTSTEAASEAQLKANSGTDSTVANKTVADKADGKDAQATTNESKEHIAQSQTQGASAVDGVTQASQANAAMSEGNKLLGQLDEANKTLNQAPNGKGLPQQGQVEQGNITGASVVGASVTDKATQQAKAENQEKSLEVDSEIAVLTGGKGVSQLTDAEIRQLMDKGVTPEQIEASMSRELSQNNAASAVTADQSQALSAADIELAKQVDAHTKALNQLNGQIESEQSVVDSLLQKQQSGAKLTVDEQAALAKATSNLDLLNQQLANVQQQATALLSQAPAANSASGEPAAIDWDNTDSSETKALAVAASTAAVATAAQQVSAQAASQSANNALTEKAAMLHANNAHAAQQAAAQQANVASPQQQATLDPALTAQGMAMNATPAATKAGSTDTLLKAGAGAAALSGLGKAGAKEDSKDSTFAQQIASASGAQGTATVGSAPTRAEIQAAQQAPLQLTKELANEQVAEKVQMMMSKNLKNLDIRLDPPELGQMKIRMTMNNDVANVHFTVSNQQARDVIEQTLPRLREMLAQQGLQLADSSVQQQNSGQGQDRYNNGEQQSGANRTNDTQGDENLDSGSNLELNVASKRDGISYYA
ncbi:flagellar hook-length control protein FliK [Vibrio coralliirubri]|uniref:flagellar hook-length control protein FliK n=1 Tax=Vibrio coralliirubri TaxID=1516159 RepID=UPI000B35BAFF|nr:flagellar hook-length control protein FliK [Vibrio coralliirubri]